MTQPLTGEQYTITAGDHEATIAQTGAGLHRYRHAGVDVTGTYPDDELPPKGCGAVLVPWPNRLRGGTYSFDGADYQVALTEPGAGNANHGLARWDRWSVFEQTPDSVSLGLDVVPQTGWPFQLRAGVRYSVGPDGLSVTLHARNTGATRLPFGTGCHPYVAAGGALDDVELELPATRHIEVDAAQIPRGTRDVAGTDVDFRTARRLGAQRLDDGFTGLTGRAATVRTPSGGARVWFDEAFGFLQVYTLEALGSFGPAVAVEPMTCAADAFNSGDGLLVLEPGQEFSGTWGITPL